MAPKTLIPTMLAFVLLISACQQAPVADAIYTHAQIWTGDTQNVWAEAIAVKDGKILLVGNASEAAAFQGSQTKTIDLEGKMVAPGFTDNHTHFLQGGFQLASVNLRTAKTPQEFIQILKTYAAQLPEGGERWILGGDWDHEAWDGELPRKEWIDSITGDHPVWVNRLDGHMALANSKALQLAGITDNTPTPAGGTIVRDPKTKHITGILKDEAMNLVYQKLPSFSEKELDEAFDRAVQHALSLGVTQVHDVSSLGGWTDLATYQRAQQTGRLPLRIYSFVPLADWQKLADFVKNKGRGDDYLRWGALKGFVDGSLGSTTAWFYTPYNDEPTTTGLQVTDTALLRRLIISADAAGLQVAVHAIGDRANDWLLSVFAEAIAKNSTKDTRRFRIEHAQHLTKAAILKFAELGVIPSMQPYHAIDDGRWAEKRIGSERIKTTYAFRSLLDANAKLTFGSDWTVAPLNPLEGIYAAVTRQTLDAKNPNGWVPEQKITIAEALTCYTANNAYAGFQESKLGKLKPGMLADFVVLSDHLFEIMPAKIKDVKVLRTIVGGKEVYRKDL